MQFESMLSISLSYLCTFIVFIESFIPFINCTCYWLDQTTFEFYTFSSFSDIQRMLDQCCTSFDTWKSMLKNGSTAMDMDFRTNEVKLQREMRDVEGLKTVIILTTRSKHSVPTN